jgi:hypothetical protein
MLIGDAIKPQRDRDAPHEWRIVLADQDHPVLRYVRACGSRPLTIPPRTITD